MATDCIVIADDSGDGSDDSLPPFSQTSKGISGTTCSQFEGAFSSRDAAPNKKAARTRASPDHVYDLTASPSTSSSKASSPSSNDLHVEKRPLNSMSVGSRFGVKAFDHVKAFTVHWSC